jgi:RNase P/RNase MRP subunit p29
MLRKQTLAMATETAAINVLKVQVIFHVKGKDKGHPTTDHKGQEGE